MPSRSIWALLLLILVAGCQKTATVELPREDSQTLSGVENGSVTLVFQLREETLTTTVDDVQPNATLAEVMRRVESPEIEMTGAGAMTFVQSIGGISTDARDGWTFTVDGQFANQGVGATMLTPPVTVQWKFGTFSP